MAAGTQSFDDELAGLFDLSHDAFCIAGFDGYLKRVNPAHARSLGYTREQLLARPFIDNIYPDDVESVEAVLAKLAAGEDIVGFECREVCADGSVRWFEWSTSSRPEAGIAYAVGRDVTDRRNANAEFSALRHVATLAAEGVAPSELLAVVAEEVARVINVPRVSVARYEFDGAATDCGSFPADAPVTSVGKQWAVEGTNVLALVHKSSQAARIDYSNLDGGLAAAVRRVGIRSTVGVPIVVAGRLWGAMMVSTTAPEPLPGDTAARLARFTELLATAIANAESREALGRLADAQAALKRVATLVAHGVDPPEVFSAVARELARVLGVQNAAVWRYESDGAATLLAAHDAPGAKKMPVGMRFTLEGDNIVAMVLHTGRPARMDSHNHAGGSAAAQIRELDLRGGVGVPIIVDGRLWGAAVVGTSRPEPLPPDAEARVEDFAHLLAATAIANAHAHAELTASRARIVAAADDARRRIERDLHDGAQQRLVSLGLQLRTAEALVPHELHSLKEQISDMVTELVGVSEDLQEISRGIHPAILSKGGLGPALKTLARRSPLPVELDLHIDRRLPDPVEIGSYYVVAEALTNAAKHAQASVVDVSVEVVDADLRLVIRDDGIGGAAPGKGSGLTGLIDRVEALGGKMTITSHAGSGTSLRVDIPVETQ